VWDAEIGHLLTTLTGHTGRVNDAAFSPDGKLIVTASADKTARLYIADLHGLLDWAKQQLPADGGSNRVSRSEHDGLANHSQRADTE
jgi:WD40 repeat protein